MGDIDAFCRVSEVKSLDFQRGQSVECDSMGVYLAGTVVAQWRFDPINNKQMPYLVRMFTDGQEFFFEEGACRQFNPLSGLRFARGQPVECMQKGEYQVGVIVAQWWLHPKQKRQVPYLVRMLFDGQLLSADEDTDAYCRALDIWSHEQQRLLPRP